MNAIALELDETLRGLDPQAAAVERRVREVMARSNRAEAKVPKQGAGVEAASPAATAAAGKIHPEVEWFSNLLPEEVRRRLNAKDWGPEFWAEFRALWGTEPFERPEQGTVEEAWGAEVRRRIEEIEAGKVEGIPVEESLARMRKMAG